MFKTLLGVGAAALILAVSGQASALSLTNRDASDHTLKITDSAGTSELVVAPEQTLSDLCQSGCQISLGEGEGMDFTGTETVAIQDGKLVISE